MSRTREVDVVTAVYRYRAQVPPENTIVVRHVNDKWCCYVVFGDVSSIEGYRVEDLTNLSEEQKRKQEGDFQ